MYESGWATWAQFAVFVAVGSLVYALYGRRHSRLTAGAVTADAAEREPQAV